MEKLIETAKDLNLKGAAVLDKFQIAELEKIYNGIGPEKFPDWLRKIITEANGLFEPAALIHDVLYHIGGDRDEFTRANDEFLRNCVTLVKARYGWYDFRRYKWLSRARRFYAYCQIFGWTSYNKD